MEYGSRVEKNSDWQDGLVAKDTCGTSLAT